MYLSFFPAFACVTFGSVLQCIPLEKQCDDLIDCNNGVDEKWCDQSQSAQVKHKVAVPPSYIYIKDNRIHVDNFFTCEETEFQCVSMELCLSYELRCNGIYDCPGREDEADCDTCPGFYRCRDSKVCLHPLSVCDADSRIQCPLGDDEILCDFICPENCTCYGLAVYCDHRFSVHSVTQLRFLEARGSGLTLADMASNTILIHLGLGSCDLRQLGNSSFPNLHILDVSDNLLTVINADELFPLSNLRVLNLSGNPLTSTFIEQFDKVSSLHRSVEVLDVSRVAFKELDTNTIALFPNLRKLDVSHSSVVKILGQEFHQLTQLTTLDLRQSPLTHFYPGFIRDLTSLQEIYADSYKLCCPEVLPSGFNLINCHAPSDEISSCDSLLRSDAYRVVLSVFAVLALIGNLGSFAYRVIVHKAGSALGFGVFVTHLSVSDFLMGLYLAIIGVADRVYKGSYLWEDVSWRNSTACNVAGFLFLTSSETSTFVLFLVTLDRFLVLNFPCSGFRFQHRSAHLACIVGWLVGAALSVTPLLPAMTSNWQLYGQNGICIPLPITQEKRFPGQFYPFNVMIVLNFTLFLLMFVGQLSVYLKVRARELDNSAAGAKSKKQRSTDLDAARRLFSVVMSDFLCWFPVGLLGLRSAAGFPVSGDVNVAMVMLVLPFNSALNPFLYAYNVFREKRRREKEQRVAKIVTLAQRGRSDERAT